MADLTDEQSVRLRRFAELVLASPHNLVSRRARGELWSRHITECLALAAMLPSGPARLLDVGSGGGLPGLVIAIARPQLAVTLVESTSKKATFLVETAATLGIEVVVHDARAEDLARGPLRAQFDLVTARAVAPMSRLLGSTVPLLAPDGLLYAVKGMRWRDELDAARGELRRVGARVVATPDDLDPARLRRGDPVRGSDDDAAPRVVIIGRSG